MYKLGHINIKWPPVVLDATYNVLEDPIQLKLDFGE
jgi:hypothetical protein